MSDSFLLFDSAGYSPTATQRPHQSFSFAVSRGPADSRAVSRLTANSIDPQSPPDTARPAPAAIRTRKPLATPAEVERPVPTPRVTRVAAASPPAVADLLPTPGVMRAAEAAPLDRALPAPAASRVPAD